MFRKIVELQSVLPPYGLTAITALLNQGVKPVLSGVFLDGLKAVASTVS